jgi:serine/threonine protein phosphatase Stp1
LLAIMVGAGSVCVGLLLATELDVRFSDHMTDWFRESLGATTIFPILLIVCLIANRLVGRVQMRAGERPALSGSIALLLGIAAVAVVLQIGLLLDHAVQIQTYALSAVDFAFLSITLIFLVQATSEEVFFRGWLQGSLAKRVHPAVAILATALIFAGLHYVVEPRHPMSAVNLLLAGIVLGLIYHLGKGLIAPILFHFGWNWSEAMLFGLTPNPGKILAGSVSDFDLVGPVLFGGGDEGLNTNSISAAVLVLIGIILLWLINRKPAAGKPPLAAKSAAPPFPPAEPFNSELEAPAPVGLVETASALPPLPSPVSLAAVVSTSPVPVATLAATHPGAVREVNEDRYYTNEALSLWAVADGMGGHKFGDRASTMIVETLATVAPTGSLEERVAITSQAILDANHAIYLEAQENGSRMGSTVVALIVSEGRYGLIWAGDSRAYRLRGQSFEQMTRDHTQVQEFVDKGELTPEQAARHPMSHVLVKAIGVLDRIELETTIGDIAPGDVFFLCSDGIYDALDDDEIAEQLMKRGSATTLDSLINLAVAQGARDNVTAIAVVPDNLKPEQAQSEGHLNS